mmetsp:Transcript_86558/g.249764  ORF Transcript_86558/g.249764 Transcript_86558/m.249764 type:complete len:196 (-) Transcript_86558:258-845(-)
MPAAISLTDALKLQSTESAPECRSASRTGMARDSAALDMLIPQLERDASLLNAFTQHLQDKLMEPTRAAQPEPRTPPLAPEQQPRGVPSSLGSDFLQCFVVLRTPSSWTAEDVGHAVAEAGFLAALDFFVLEPLPGTPGTLVRFAHPVAAASFSRYVEKCCKQMSLWPGGVTAVLAAGRTSAPASGNVLPGRTSR